MRQYPATLELTPDSSWLKGGALPNGWANSQYSLDKSSPRL